MSWSGAAVTPGDARTGTQLATNSLAVPIKKEAIVTLHYSDYYSDYRWCPSCRTYVHFLSALEKSYCVQCGGRIRCFRTPRAVEEAPSHRDDETFHPQTNPEPDPGLPHSA